MSEGMTPEEVAADLNLTTEHRVMLEPLLEGLSVFQRKHLFDWAKDTIVRANLLRAASEGHARILISDGEVRFSV